ncbi:MAG: malto-oligosyltrehalose trehalohydrolase [Bryobacterales bacterium]|nr:malto-oligosyltrehalose trehalohydrolase [Bryobacterales bacterium]
MRQISLTSSLDIGAAVLADGRTHFRVWAPRHSQVELRFHAPNEMRVPMEASGDGYFEVLLDRNASGFRYTFVLDGELERPDPASRFQQDGVHGPSTVVGGGYQWKASHWHGIALASYLIYEIHIGTFTPQGTLDAAIARIPYLQQLGITAVELMPVAQCPGDRNWGYDGVYPYAVQSNYGGPEALKRFVDACHLAGIAVVLDVVYNHLGPEGNYLRDFGPYFTDRHHTPWGEGINFDGPDSGPVRHFFLQNALHWVTEFRIDALRLDATDTIYDFSPKHFLAELASELHQRGEALNRRIYSLAETAANDVRWIQSQDRGGFGLDAQWHDDFHHALRQRLSGEQRGYFADYPHFRHLVRSLSDGFVYQGEYSVYRRRSHGSPSLDISPERFIVCCQNHDQIGNRMLGDRLGHVVDLPKLKLAAAWVIFSPYLPLLFMGEEYNEPAPFPYFVSHGDPNLVEAVREGRKREFAAFAWEGHPPDPQAETTFESARIDPSIRERGEHGELFRFYRQIIELRKQLDPLAFLSRTGMRVNSDENTQVVWVSRQFKSQECVIAFAFNQVETVATFPFVRGTFRKRLDTNDSSASTSPTTCSTLDLRHGDSVPLSPHSVLLLERLSALPDKEG